MKLWRGLSRRILVVSVLCALLGLVLSQLFTMRAAREALRATVAPYLNRAFDDNQRRACESDPEHWSLTLEPGARLDAYDEQTLKSRNPSAPPLDDLLYKRLTLGEAHPVRFYRLGSEYGGALLMRTGTEGPCAIVQASLPPHPAARRWRSGILLGIGVVALALAACIGVVAAVRPLTRRIGRLRAAAQGVGTSGYGSAGDATGDELGELSQILDQAHERIRLDAQILQERQRALEQYLTDIAHDLRTPIGSLQIALEQALDVRSEKERGELLQTALKDVVYLAGLTNNLRLACQLRDGWDPVADNATCDLADVVERVAASGRVFAKRRGIALEVSRPDATVRVRCHPTAVEQAVRNIVENAISYGDPGGHVAVLLDVTRSAPSKASGDTASSSPKDRFFLSVIDDGPGVAPALLPRLGERTFRSDEARQRDPDGSGLGLAITSEICARSGWTILFGTATPRGLRVEIEGPVEPSSSPHGPQ